MYVPERLLKPELMDDPSLDPAAHAKALRGLRRINWWSRTASYLAGEISRVAAERGIDQVRVLDVACGGGEMARNLAAQLKQRGLNAEVDGCDISNQAVAYAEDSLRRAGRNGARYFQHDALGTDLPTGYDFIVTTLFLHHLSRADAVNLLRRMAAAASEMVLVDDLIRSRLGYYLAWGACRVLSRSPVVHHDGPVSVQAAFSMAEALRIAEEAGLANSRCRRHWPERYLLSWEAAR
ncbi:MAG: methyltransferase domain-containing protein [Planctomycetales bacterium]|nr:methyltransferase domain-containing protein [Planctomycetales bacterium]